MPMSVCFTQNLSQDSEVWKVLPTTDVRNVRQGQRVPDHHVLPISGGQAFPGIVPLAFFLVPFVQYANGNRIQARSHFWSSIGSSQSKLLGQP